MFLDKVPDITRDRINFKETLKILEATAISAAYKESEVIIDDLVIDERPDIEIGRVKLEDQNAWGFDKPSYYKKYDKIYFINFNLFPRKGCFKIN